MRADIIGIVSLLLLAPFDAHSSADVTTSSYLKLAQAPKFNISTIVDGPASSEVYCGMLCSDNDACVFFKWTSTTGVCSLYQQADGGVSIAFSLDMYMKQGQLPCTGVKVRDGNGACVCPVGLYDHQCSTTFSQQLFLQQKFYMDWGVDVNHLEIDGVSFIFLLSSGNGSSTTATTGGYVAIHSRDSQVSATYAFRQIIYLDTQCQRLHPFKVNGNAYFVVSNLKSIDATLSTVPHLLYKYDPTTQSFFELHRWSELGGGLSAVYQRPNGDTYLCIAANNVNITLIDQNPYIYKFDPSTETFQLTFYIPHTGIHESCVFFEISGQLYSMTSIFFSAAKNKIYRLNADETWSWHQDVPSTSNSFIQGIDAYTSPQLSLLACANIASYAVHVFRWNGTQFNTMQTVSLSTYTYTPRLTEVAGRVYLFVDDTNTNAKKFKVFRYNETLSVFQAFAAVNGDGPAGRFQQFWYADSLYLLATNSFNGSYSVGNPLHFHSNQQLFQWL